MDFNQGCDSLENKENKSLDNNNLGTSWFELNNNFLLSFGPLLFSSYVFSLSILIFYYSFKFTLSFLCLF